MIRGAQWKQSLDREKINVTEQTKRKTRNLKIAKKRGGTGLRKTNDKANIYTHFKK
jgi:hypothetical protein